MSSWCPDCNHAYDESEYSKCPYCSGELWDDDEEIDDCPECGGVMYWDEDEQLWICKNCEYTKED